MPSHTVQLAAIILSATAILAATSKALPGAKPGARPVLRQKGIRAAAAAEVCRHQGPAPRADLRREPAVRPDVLEDVGTGLPQLLRAQARQRLRLAVHRRRVQREHLPVGHLLHDHVLQLRASAGSRHRLAGQLLLPSSTRTARFAARSTGPPARTSRQWVNREEKGLLSRWGAVRRSGTSAARPRSRRRTLTLDALDHPIFAWAELESMPRHGRPLAAGDGLRAAGALLSGARRSTSARATAFT